MIPPYEIEDKPNDWTSQISNGLTDVNKLLGNVNTIANQWNNIGQPTTTDKLNNIDLNAPGSTVSSGSNPFFDITGQFVPGQVAEAANIYNQGAPELNALQTGAYDAVDPTAGTQTDLANLGVDYTKDLLDPNSDYNKRLAEIAGGATAGGAAATGGLGGLRHSYAANKAASDAILNSQQTGFGNIATSQGHLETPLNLQTNYGNQYYDWQSNAPWDHLGKFQNATGFGQNVPGSTASTVNPSGVDKYNAILGAEVAKNKLAEAGIDTGAASGPLTGVQNTVSAIDNTLTTGKNIWDAGSSIADTVGDWWDSWSFAQGGQVPQQPMMMKENKKPDWF